MKWVINFNFNVKFKG